MRITALFALTITLTACGLQEDASQPPADDGTSGASDTDVTDAPDAGSPAPDAGTPADTSDAGSPAPDAGTTPAPDAGDTVPTPDAGTPTPDAGTPPAPDAGSPDAGTPTYLPDPVSSPSSLHLLFADYYMSGSTCGDVKGNLPGTNWNDDYTGLFMQDTDGDGYLELALAATPAGTYVVTYRDRECPGQPQIKAWAHYGEKDMIRQMRIEAKRFLQCNWWNGTAEVTVTSPGCNIQLSIDGNGLITGAGNMADYN